MAKRFNGKLISMISNVKNVYAHNFPYDTEIINQLDDKVTFTDILYGMTKGDNPYKLIFKNKDYADSLARERIFDLLAIVSGLKVNKIYNIWYNAHDLKNGIITIDKV